VHLVGFTIGIFFFKSVEKAQAIAVLDTLREDLCTLIIYRWVLKIGNYINPLNTELNPICQ